MQSNLLQSSQNDYSFNLSIFPQFYFIFGRSLLQLFKMYFIRWRNSIFNFLCWLSIDLSYDKSALSQYTKRASRYLVSKRRTGYVLHNGYCLYAYLLRRMPSCYENYDTKPLCLPNVNADVRKNVTYQNMFVF